MMRWIVGASMQLRVLVVVIAALIMVFGATQLRQMPVDVLPEFSQPYVEIQTESLGLSAEEVEQLITTPMEQDLLVGLPWLKTIRSESVPGLSSVVLLFEPGTDLMRARQMVSERMTQAVAMPHVSKPPTMLQPLSATNRVMILGLSSKTVSHIQMSVLARWTIQPRLMGVPGVANVSIWGQRDRQLQVQVDPKRLQERNISLLQVLETTGNSLWVSSLSFVEASTPGTGGFIDTANQRLGIRHILPIVSAKDLSEVPIEGAKDVHLADVANVVENNQPLIGDALTGEGPGLLLVIEKFPGANTMEVTRAVEKEMSDLSPGLAGITIDKQIFRPADYIEAATSNLSRAAIIGFALLSVVLVVFFFDWRIALISMIAIPLSLIVAGLVLYLRGATFNMLTLTGFVAAIGVVVYDAIIDLDNITRRLCNRTDRSVKATAHVIADASHEARGPIVYATLIMLLVVAPIYFIGGSFGAYFRPLAISYSLAIVASMVVTLTVVPALFFTHARGARADVRRESTLLQWLRLRYESALSHSIHRGRVILAAVAVLAVAGIAILPLLSRAPLPQFKELSMLIQVKSMPGTSQPEMSRITGRMGNELRKLDGIQNVGAHIGRAVMGDQIVDVNSAELWVTIDPKANYNKAAQAIKTTVEGYPGLSYTVQTYLREKSGDVIQEPEDKVVVRVYGSKYPELGATAKSIDNTISGIKGIEKTRVKTPIQEAALETEVDLVKAQKLGLKPGDVRRAAACLLSGIQVGALYEDQRIFDVVVWSTPETRQSLSSISNLMIDAPGGTRVRLGDVANVSIKPAASVIRHDGVKRYVDIAADVHGRDLDAVAADITDKLKGMTFPLEYHATVLGEYAKPKLARDHLVVMTIVSAIGVFFLLESAFGSWRLAAISFLTIPAALIGGLLTALATGGTVISLGSLTGLLAVFGITVCGSITLTKHYQRLTAVPTPAGIDPEVAQFCAQIEPSNGIVGDGVASGAGFGPGLVLYGTIERFGPILVTALATAAALAPVLFLGDVPGFEIIRPMVIVILGGLITSTLFTLFAVPTLFLLFGPGRGSDLDDVMLSVSDEELREAMVSARISEQQVGSTIVY